MDRHLMFIRGTFAYILLLINTTMIQDSLLLHFISIQNWLAKRNEKNWVAIVLLYHKGVICLFLNKFFVTTDNHPKNSIFHVSEIQLFFFLSFSLPLNNFERVLLNMLSNWNHANKISCTKYVFDSKSC